MESIKCHHNHIANYIADNIIQNQQYFNDINIFSLKYYNFLYFELEKININDFFIYACKYDFFRIVEILINSNSIDIEHFILNIILFHIFKACCR